jgi:multicomponent Na+:H+ antiporter subunit D
MMTVILSLFSGSLCFVLKGRTARYYTIFYEAFLLIVCGAILWYTVSTGGAVTYPMGEFPAPWGNELRAGILEALLATLFMVIMIVSVLAGYRFIDTDLDESKVNLYYAILNLMTASLMAILWTNDLFSGYVFLEILTLTSCGSLIVREIGRTTLAAVRYMILNLLGSGLFLLGVVLLYDVTGHLLMVPMQETIAELAQDPKMFMVLTLSTGVLTIGLSIKSGLFPFHFWMPDSYSWSTPTSASILSSLVSKAYILLLIKIFYRAIGLEVFERMPIKEILLILGIMGMVVGSLQAMHADNINRMVAFSSAAQVGYIFMGMGLGGIAGYTAAIFHIMAHAVTKSMLFLTTPRLAEVSDDSLLFKKLQASALRNRDAGIFFLIGSLSMIGIPLFAGFASKLQFALAGVESGSHVKLVAVILALAASSLLNAVYFIRTLIRIYSDPHGTVSKANIRQHHRPLFNVPMMVLGAINLFLGLFSWVVIDLITRGLEMFG